MGKKYQELQVKRLFSEEFKMQCVDDYERGRHTVLELSRLFKIRHQVIYRWIYKYSVYNKKRIKVVEMSESSQKKVKELEKRIKELEGLVGRKQIKLDYYEKLMEVAQEMYGIEIPKNVDTPHSKPSIKIKKK
jgi:transposase